MVEDVILTGRCLRVKGKGKAITIMKEVVMELEGKQAMPNNPWLVMEPNAKEAKLFRKDH